MAAGGGDGGAVFSALDDRAMRVVGTDGTKQCTEALIIAHSTEAGTTRHLELLNELRDDTGAVIEGVPAHTVHDLTSRMIAKSKASLKAYNKAFKDQTSGTALGFVHASNFF